VQRRGRPWGFPWAQDASQEARIAYQVETLGLDQVVPVALAHLAPAAGVSSRVWMEGEILHKAYTTPAGELHAAVTRSDLWPHGDDIPFFSDFNIGHFVEPWLTGEADLQCLKQILRLREPGETLDSARKASSGALALAARYGLATIAHVGTGLTGAMQLFGAVQLCTLVMDQPDLVRAYLAHEHEANLAAVSLLGEMGVDIVRRNGFYETADFYGPGMLEEFLGERLRREADAAHGAGMLTSYTVHTGVMGILDYLASLTTDSLFGIDIAFRGVDLGRVRDTLCPTKALWIGPSSTFHLWEGPEATRAAVREVVGTFGRTGLVLSPCVSAHSIMPWESTAAMVDEWRRSR